MKPEANIHYFSALFLCAAVIWLVGPLILSLLFDAPQDPTIPAKVVSPEQAKAVWIDTLRFVGVMGWVVTLGYCVARGNLPVPQRRPGRGSGLA